MSCATYTFAIYALEHFYCVIFFRFLQWKCSLGCVLYVLYVLLLAAVYYMFVVVLVIVVVAVVFSTNFFFEMNSKCRHFFVFSCKSIHCNHYLFYGALFSLPQQIFTVSTSLPFQLLFRLSLRFRFLPIHCLCSVSALNCILFKLNYSFFISVLLLPPPSLSLCPLYIHHHLGFL